MMRSMGRTAFGGFRGWALGFGEWGLVEGVSSATMHTRVVTFAAFFVVFTLCLSSYLVFQHLNTYNDPSEQRWLIGIIFMIPVYSVASFVSLWAPEISLECNILGNCYEAFAMYSFGRYLIACLGEEDATVMQKLEKQDSVGPQKPLLDDHSGDYHMVYHPVPFSWFLDPWQLGRQFYDAVKFGIVQYMILKTTCVWLSLVLEQFDLYGEGEFDWSKGYPYITLTLNFSQTWALYCLIQFYHATKKELRAIHPLAKFVTFKAVVFVTWWQGVIIAFIFSSGLAFRWFSKKEIFIGHVQSGLQDLIICVEMAIAAVAHVFVYPATPYVQEFNIMGIVAKTMVEEDLEGTLNRVKENAHDVIFGGGEDVVHDVRFTVHHAVEPLGTHITKIKETYQETKETWSHHGHKCTVRTNKRDTYNVANDDEDYEEENEGENDEENGGGGGGGSGGFSTSGSVEIVKETETVEKLDLRDEGGRAGDVSHLATTTTTEVSYNVPAEMDGPAEGAGSGQRLGLGFGGEDSVFVRSSSCRRRQY